MRAKALLLMLWPGMAVAQAPLSAIDWLNDTAPAPVITPPAETEPPVADAVLVPSVASSPLDAATADAVGLLSPAMTGLPVTLWRSSEAHVLEELIAAQKLATLPAMQALFYTLMLAEADPPSGSNRTNGFLTTRVDALLDLGAVEAVQALMDRAGASTPALFARWFDATLLTGDEDAACNLLGRAPHLSPGYAAQVFCTARNGDWDTAALTLDTARTLKFLSPQQETLLMHFLDPELAESEPLPHPPVRPSPLVFRLREAIGEPMPTAPLPRAFAVADLRGTVGWKAQIEAAERLAQTGALSENRLLGIYTERLPAASGGIWDRVDAVQRFDIAIKARDPGAIGKALPKAFTAMKVARLEAVFAKLYAPDLLKLPLDQETKKHAYRITLLSAQYEAAAQKWGGDFPQMSFLTALAKGQPGQATPRGEVQKAIRDGFSSTDVPEIFRADVRDGRLGEVILRAMLLYERAVSGETKELATALTAFRSIGLEDVARQAALQILLLDRRF